MIAEYEREILEHPKHLHILLSKFKPWKLYRMDTGNIATIETIDKNVDGTLTFTVFLAQRFNHPLLLERSVFGVKPEDLAEVEELDKS